jgi:hypothetical protein
MLRTRCAFLTLGFLALAGAAHAQSREVIYRCTDASGAARYTAEPAVGCVVVAVNGQGAGTSARLASQTRPITFSSSVPKRAAQSSTYYANCSAARAAGAAPVRAGDPGYSRKLDRDGDGVGCE